LSAFRVVPPLVAGRRLRGRAFRRPVHPFVAGLAAAFAAAGTFAAPPGPPGAVSGTVDGERVTLSWIAASDDEGVTGYNVHRDGRYLITVDGTRLVTELGDGATTRFQITAFDTPSDGSARGYSRRAEATFARADTDTPPSGDGDTTTLSRTPTAASPIARRLSPTSVLLSWTPARAAAGVRGYNVYRDGRFLTSVSGTSFVDDRGIVAGQVHDYYLVAYAERNPSLFGPRSAVVTVAAGSLDPDPEPDMPERPAVVIGLSSPSATPDRVVLEWLAPAYAVRGYNIYRDDAYVTTVDGAESWIDANPPADAERIVYQVVAITVDRRYSPYSDELVVRPVEDSSNPGTDPAALPVTFTGGEENNCERRELGIYVTTLAEACSLGGPSRTDGNRTDAAPSAPTGVTTLLVADDWVQIDWIPSADDGDIVAYDIFRDDQLVGSVVDPDTVPETERSRLQARRYWRTTTYLDCDYTRFICNSRPRPGTTHSYTVVAIDDAGNRSAASAPWTVTMNTIRRGAAAPDLASEGYVEVFADEFDGDRLDRGKWVTRLSYDQFADGSAVNGERQYFIELDQAIEIGVNPYVFEDGALKLTAYRTPAGLLDTARGQPYISGLISSRSKFEGLRYGHAEIRAKVPSGNGLLATFFLFQPTGNQYEIDILEYLGRVPDGATQNYHYRDGFRFASNDIFDDDGNPVDGGNAGVPHVSPTMQFDGDVDLSDDFHTYSVRWEPGLVIWYIDNEEVRRLSGPRVSNRSMDLVAQFVVGSPGFAGDPSATPFPAVYEIDYIRAYEKRRPRD